MAKCHGPSMRAQILGQRLSAARKKAKISMQSAADYLQVDQSKISRMESAIYPARKAEVIALLDFYIVSDERQRGLMLQLTEDIWRKGWWNEYREDVDQRFVDYAWLESRADRIMSFEVLALSGLLQTKEYATAVISRADSGVSEEQLDRLVNLRMTRQQVVPEAAGKRLDVVIDESALRRPVGSRQIMRSQLKQLLMITRQDNVLIRVLPLEVGWHGGFPGQFALFELPEPYPDVAFTESLAGQTYVEESDDVERFRLAYAQLSDAALSAKKSFSMISAILKEM